MSLWASGVRWATSRRASGRWPCVARCGAALMVVSLLGACGFALQGARSLPAQMSTTLLQVPDERSPLAVGLRRELRAAGASLAATRREAGAVLRVSIDESGERILSVSSTGVPEEYELFHSVRFELEVEGEAGLAPETITVTRDYRFDANDILGKQREALFLQQAMVKDLVQLVIRRLDLLAREAAGAG